MPPTDEPMAAPAPPPTPAGPTFDPETGRLTRAGMERAIKEGGSVMHDGRVISSLGELPSAAEMAKGDPAKEAEVRRGLLAARAALDAQLAVLSDQFATTAAAPPAEGGEPQADDKAKHDKAKK